MLEIMPHLLKSALRSLKCGYWTTILLTLATAIQTTSGVTLAWDASPDAGVTGYAVRYGTISSNYTFRADVGNVTSATISNLTEGVTYYFVAVAYTADGVESLPSNEVAYSVPTSPTNAAPQVIASADQAITLPSSAILTATVADDGLPANPGVVSVAWSIVSGPGSVTFSAPASTTTTASFSMAGVYVIRASATDGELSASDDVTVTIAEPLTLAGTIKTRTGQPVAGVAVTLSGDSAQTTTTASDGTYAFAVTAGGSYTVTPTKIDDTPPTAGVSTADISYIRRHILGLATLDSPYRILAADVNQAKDTSTADITYIRRLILGLSTSMGPTLWQFVPSEFSFSDPANPWSAPIPASHSYASLASSATGQDFVAIKMGDANDSWLPSGTGSALQVKRTPLAVHTSGPAVTFSVASQSVTPGQVVTLPIAVSGFQKVTSAQFTLAWNPAVLQLLSIDGLALPGLSAGSFNAAKSGKLAFAWYDPAGSGCSLEDGTAIFSVQFKVVSSSGTASALTFTDSPTMREVCVENSVATLTGLEGQVIVTENAPARCLGIQAKSDGSLVIGFAGVPGKTYTVEYCESLSAPTWLPLGKASANTQGRFEYIDTPSADSISRFYRLVDAGE